MGTPQALPPDGAISRTDADVYTPWWVALTAGIAMAIAGLLILLEPGLTLVVLVQFIGITWLIDGVVRLVSIFVDRSGWGWKLLAGLLAVLGGVAVVQHPLWSAMFVPSVFTFYFGALGILIGVVQLVMAFRGAGWNTAILGVTSIVLGALLAFNPFLGVVALPLVFGGLALVGGIVTAVLSFKLRTSARSA